MCRPRMPLSPCLFCVLLLGWPAAGRAQPLLPEDDIDRRGFAKERAKALFESTQTTMRELTQARLEAAQIQMLVRYEKYRAGAQDATLDLLLEAAAFLTEAELGALEKPTPAERLKPLTAHWLYTLSAEQIVESKYRIGRVSLADLMQARRDCLDAEIKLRDAGQKLSEPFPIASLLPGPKNSFADFEEKEAAKHAFETGRTDLHDLARQRRDAAYIAFQVRYEKYREGAQDATLDLLLKSAAFLTEAELGALEKPTLAERQTILTARWLYTLTAEYIVRGKYRLGRVSLADFAQVQYARLDVEIKLRGADAGKKLPAPFVSAYPLAPEEEAASYLDTKEMAKCAFETGRADLRDLALARVETARVQIRVRREKIRAGAQDSTLNLELEAARRLLDAELAVHDDPAERLAAHERYWEFLRENENMTHAKYEAGRISIADYMGARYARLDAEIRMREARAKVK